MSVHSIYVRATPERVWEALTKPEITRTYFDFLNGLMEVDSSWEVGAPVAYRVGGRAHIEGRVLEIRPPSLLVMSISLRYFPGLAAEPPSRLRWEITPMDEVSKVSVAHEDTDGSPESAREAAGALPSILGYLRSIVETGKPRMFKSVVMDCADPVALASFWSAAIGYVVAFANEGLSSLVDPQGLLPEVEFQKVPEAKTVKNRVHLDLQVLDLVPEVERLTSLGARVLRQSEDHALLADPEGNEFCLTC